MTTLFFSLIKGMQSIGVLIRMIFGQKERLTIKPLKNRDLYETLVTLRDAVFLV